MSNTNLCTIGNICDRFSSGKSILSSKIKNKGSYPVFGGNGIRGYTDTYNFDGECAIIGRQGAYCGNVKYFNGKAYMTEHAIVACAKPEYNTGYLAYKLALMNLGQYQGQSAQPGLSVNTLSKILVDMPQLDYQNKIFNCLRALDDKIESNNKINFELELMAKAIYDYWFLQFDFPDDNGKPYKSSGGKMVWNEELKKEIPDGWSVGNLSRYIAKDKGGDWGKEVEEGNYIKRVICLRGADFPSITGNSKLVAPVRYILEKNKSKVLENGDLIIEISGGSPTQSTGRICYINNNLLERFDTDIVTSNFCKAISLNDPNCMYWFYVQWLKIYDNNVLFKYEGKTTGIKNLLFDMFINDYKIALPPNELIIQYNNMVCAMYEEIQKKQKESQELVSLRDFLLPLLMNGQVGFK